MMKSTCLHVTFAVSIAICEFFSCTLSESETKMCILCTFIGMKVLFCILSLKAQEQQLNIIHS